MNTYYKWIFSMRKKRLSRLKFQPLHSRLFKRSIGAILPGRNLLSGRKKDLQKRIFRFLILASGTSFLLGFCWLAWESLKVFQVF